MSQLAVSDPPGFAELSKAEQIEYLQNLWDRIAEKPEELGTEEHLAIAEQRLEQYRRDPGHTHSADEVIDRLSGKGR